MDTLGYLLVAAGLILMAAELLLPTGGILFVLGIAALIVGVTMTFAYDARHGLITVIALFVILPIAAPLLLYWWPRRRWAAALVLSGPDDDAAVAIMPVNLELERLRGRYGKNAVAAAAGGG